MALLATYPLMTISTMQATRGKAPEAVAAAPLSPSPKGGDGQPPVIRKTQRGAFADVVEVWQYISVWCCWTQSTHQRRAADVSQFSVTCRR